jgi:hypothetical protein
MTDRARIYRALTGAAVLAIALAGWTGCSDDDDGATPPSTETGRVRVHMTDAPFPFSMVDAAVVIIDSVSLHLDAASDQSGWITIDETERELNLLALQNGTTELLADADVPAGEVDQLRLHVREASVVLTDGRTFDLDIPSGDRSGIKIFPSPNIQVEGDLTTELLLDFDVSNSFHPIPASPNHVDDIREFQFRPSLHVVNLSAAGSIAGTAFTTLGTESELDDLPLQAASITVYSGPTEVASTASSATGSFRVLGLPAGEYTVVATSVGFLEASTTVTVEAGAETSGLELRLSPIGG